MANKTLKSLHPFLQENNTSLKSGGTLKSYSHDTGSGPVLCMVHGWPQSSYMWRHIIPSLKSHISLFIPELPGYGFSSLPPSHDKRTVGKLILNGLQTVFTTSRPIIWCGHDRGARIGHRLLADNDPSYNITSAILMDIVPTTVQWQVFSNPRASAAYYHWSFLAINTAPALIQAMGGAEFCRVNLERARGSTPRGVELFNADDAVEVYCSQFSQKDCIEGSCGDYAAGAGEDVDEQAKDQKAGKKINRPTLIVYSASNLGRMHDVPAAWSDWIDPAAKDHVRFESMKPGIGHYLPEEAPEEVAKLVLAWIEEHATTS